MKTSEMTKVITTLAACVLALSAGSPLAVRADEPMKPMHGGEHMMMLQQLNKKSQAEELKPGDTVVMVCAKCKSATVENVTTEKGHIKLMTVGEKHLCPGCNSTITVVGAGKGKKDQVRHVCEKCGSNSAFCCATQPGSGPTEGMQK